MCAIAHEQHDEQDDRISHHDVKHVGLGPERIRALWRIDVLDGQDKLRRDDEHANRAAEDDEVSLASPAHALDEHEHVDEQQGTPQRVTRKTRCHP